MASDSRYTPVIVGVGDFVNRSKDVKDALEPLDLIVKAIDSALQDTSLSKSQIQKLQSSIDSIDVTATWTWPYHDLPGSIAQRLKVKPLHKHYSDHGGNQPAKLLDDASRRVSFGESKVAIVTGGEALASLTACAQAGKIPPPGWTPPSKDISEVFSPTTRELAPSVASKHSIGAPIHIYPLYENAFRSHRNQNIVDNNAESAKMYAQFASIATSNEVAWNYKKAPETAQSIGMVSKRNRMICLPYPLLMNAFNTVNLSAAAILTTTEYANELGIPRKQWIYPLGGAGTSEHNDFWKRPTFWWSPAISRSLDAAIETSAIQANEIDIFDFYSCFPIVPKLACQHLGISIEKPEKPITVLGGLTSFGGASNNYSMHAITEVTRQLRAGKGRNALVLANGGWISYEFAVCLSSSPRPDGLPYPDYNPLPPTTADVQVPRFTEEADGNAFVETYTVEFNRDGTPLRGHVVGRLFPSGERFIANHADNQALKELTRIDIDPIGRSGIVEPSSDGRNVFSFGATSRL